MKQTYLLGIISQLQTQNMKLKDDSIHLRKQLNAYEQLLMTHLRRLDHTKIIYDSPFQCLQVFVQEMESVWSSQIKRNSDHTELQNAFRQTQHLNECLSTKNSELILNLQRTEQQLKHVAQQKAVSQRIKQNDIKELTIDRNKYKRQLQDYVERTQIKEMKLQQEKRMVIAAAISNTKHELITYREQLERECLQETAKLREELKAKDQSFKKMVKGFQKYQTGNNVDSKEIGEMLVVINKISDFQKLNQTISVLREENANAKKQLKDANNKRISLQAKNNELKIQIVNLKSQFQRKIKENQELMAQKETIEAELHKQKQSTKVLQHYFAEKWNSEFQNVKKHLQKAYDDKVKQLQNQLQGKKAEISRKIQSYIFIHKEDVKAISELKLKIQQRQSEIQVLKQTIDKLNGEIKELNIIIRESNCMQLQCERSAKLQNNRITQKYISKITELSDEVQLLSYTSLNFQDRVKEISNNLKEELQVQKMQIRQNYQIQKLQIIVAKQAQIHQIQQERKEQMLKNIKKQEHIKFQHSQQIYQIQNKLSLEIAAKIQQHRQEKAKHYEEKELMENRERALKKQMQQMKFNSMQKIRDLQKQIDHKKATSRLTNDKSQNDQKLKKQLRLILQTKAQECKQLVKQKQDFRNQIQAKDSEIHHLNCLVSELTVSKEEWLNLILEVRQEFIEGLREVNQNHWRQVQIHQSKIFQLENIILKRPIRFRDEKKIRSLSQQKKMLEGKVDLKEAENIILKQIKRYYEKKEQITKYSVTDSNFIHNDFKKSGTILILAKKPKRMKILMNDRFKNEQEQQTETQKDMKMMKRYIIERGKQRQSLKKHIRHSSSHKSSILPVSAQK